MGTLEDRGEGNTDQYVIIDGEKMDLRFLLSMDITNIRSIASPLSKICRYAGRVRDFYSVAEHSILVAKMFMNPRLAKYALLHDGHEALIGDIIFPIKRFYTNGDLRILIDRLDKIILGRFDLPWPFPQEIIDADHEFNTLEWEYFAYGKENPGIKFLDYRVAQAKFEGMANDLGLR